MALHRSRDGLDLLVTLERGAGPLHVQLERGLRGAILDGRLIGGTSLPASRGLAEELGVSRSVATEAYAQLAAEGFVELRPRRLPRVALQAATPLATPPGAAAAFPQAPNADAAARATPGPAADGRAAVGAGPAPAIRFDLRPGAPSLAHFPRAMWLRNLKRALDALSDAELDYPAPEGTPRLRGTLAAYLGRVRGVRTQAPLVCAGVSQALWVACTALRAAGCETLGIEDPGHAGVRGMLRGTGLDLVGVPVDGEGLVVDAIPDGVGAVLVSPAHQYPTGVVLSAARRRALVAWARTHDAWVLEDDYDAEFRYGSAPVAALQGLAPDRVAAMSSVSKTLAPGLRLGWLTTPPGLSAPLIAARHAIGHGLSVIEQTALAEAIEHGDYDRHVRRARREYRARRDLLVAALADALPACSVDGIAAGLHLTLGLPTGTDEAALVARAAAAGVALDALGRHRITASGPPGLVLGYGRLPTPAVPAAVAALGAALAGPDRATASLESR